MKVLSCPSCGAAVGPDDTRCPYCHSYFERPIPEQERRQDREPPVNSPSAGAVTYQRLTEPNEGAFSLSVPYGWQIEGGIFRSDLTRQVIDAQSIEAKLNFAVKKDAAGSVSIRWCPDMKYCDLRMSPAGMMGLFPPGSNYQGMIVHPLMSAQDFLNQVVFPWAHPEASGVQIVAQESLPLLVQIYRSRMAALGLPANFSYDGGFVTYVYEESGIRYQERAYAVIENMGPMAAGMWSNKDTILLRGPEGEFERWEPILHHVRESVKISHEWLAREIVNQEFLSRAFLNAQQASQARDRRMLEIQQQLRQLDREIVEHRQRTNAEIQNDAYLTLMDQEEYINPYSNEPEVGSNQWDHRWVNADGDEFYTDNGDDDPNVASLLNRSDWKRSAVRPRFPDGE